MPAVPSQSPAKPAVRRPRPDNANPTEPPEGPLTAGGFAAAPDGRQVVTLASLTQVAETYLPPDDLRRIREAYRFSDDAHLGQFRFVAANVGIAGPHIPAEAIALRLELAPLGE